jgi:hypothetical protein
MSAELVSGITLDGLFRGNVAARPEAVALADPPDRTSFANGAPRQLSYAAADAQVARLAAIFGSFGLPPGSPFAVQLPNITESPLTLLAILRAGMTALPVPLAWRRSDLVAALAPLQPKAIVTVGRFLDERLAETVCEAAAELFSLSFPCAFGEDLPDGVLSLDIDTGSPDVTSPPDFGGTIATFDAKHDGYFAARRNDAQWLAAGLTTLLEAHIETGDTIASAMPLHSLAGIGGAFVPWLLSGGTLQLLQGNAVASKRNRKVHLIAPPSAVPAFAAHHPFASCVAAHRGPRTLTFDFSGCAISRLIDLVAIGEFAVVASARENLPQPMPLPLGPITALSGSAGAPVMLETRLCAGEIHLRGPMLPDVPAGAEGFVATGWRGESDGNGGLLVIGAPERVVTVGGLRFGLDDLQSRLRQVAPGLQILAIEDNVLGERLHVAGADAVTAAALEAAGHSRLVIEATQQSALPRRATG